MRKYLLLLTVFFLAVISLQCGGRKEKPAPGAAPAPAAKSVDQAITERRHIKAQMHASIAEDLISKAESLQHRDNPPFVYMDSLLKDAQQEWKYAYELGDDQYSEMARIALARVESLRDAIKANVRHQKTRIRKAILEDKLVYGMTEWEVIQVAGPPVERQPVPGRDNFEKWTYNADTSLGRMRVFRFFEDGIFVAGQTADIILRYQP